MPAAAGGRAGDVLVLVSAIAPWGAAATVGAELAARWHGTLTGCYLDPALSALKAVEAEPTVMALLYEDIAQHADAAARADFAGFAARHGVTVARWSAVRTGVAQTLRELGAWHDLAVLERELVTPEGLFEVLGEALLGCRLPCLVLPGNEQEATFGRIAIGWNGSLEAIRAIRAALPLLAAAGEVHLLDGALEPEVDLDGLPRFDPSDYLARHGIAARRCRLHTDPKSAGQALLHEAQGCDLLVMGAYGHSRLRERVLGGATRHVLAHAHMPVLMMH